MPYSITTKDGITINNIPDGVPADSPELKARVAAIRAGQQQAPTESVLEAAGAPTPEEPPKMGFFEGIAESVTVVLVLHQRLKHYLSGLECQNSIK